METEYFIYKAKFKEESDVGGHLYIDRGKWALC